MRGFDIFRKIRDDIETSTWVGGIYTILAFIAGILLIISQVKSYNQTSWVKEFRVEEKVNSQMDISLEIWMKRAPCYMLSVYIKDEFDTKSMPNVVNYTRVNSEGVTLQNQSYAGQNDASFRGSQAEKDAIYASARAKEGCRLSIQSKVQKLPGSIEISFDDMKGQFLEVAARLSAAFINLDYKLESIDFGDVNPAVKSLKQFNGEPLNYDAYLGLETGGNYTGYHSYVSFFKVVPTKFIHDKPENAIETMQFSQSFLQIDGPVHQHIVALFKYDVSPITMLFRLEEKNLYHLIVQLCAVGGGIFALMGIMNSLTWDTISLMKKTLTRAI